jgi:SAM-dependent methyltransferase
MPSDGPEFFNDPEVFEQYSQHRQSRDNPNDTMEKPIVLELLGRVEGARILDLGCGDGQFGKELLNARASSYFGVDGSARMVGVAIDNLSGTTARVIHADIRSWSLPRNAFDIVLSRLAFHYVENLDNLLHRTFDSLISRGRLVFSVEHPVLTSCDKALPAGATRQDWIVDNYFNVGERITQWMGGVVVKYHRTVEDYFMSLRKAGFVVMDIREGRPESERFSTYQNFERRKRIPLFLIFNARKPSCNGCRKSLNRK